MRPPEERAEYEESIKPFLAPFDALISTGAVDGGSRSSTRSSRSSRRRVPRPPSPAQEENTQMAVRIRLTRVGATKQPTYQWSWPTAPRARQPRDRDHRPLQPANRADRAQRRRGQGEGVARQGRPAVRHRRPPVQAGRHPARRQVGGRTDGSQGTGRVRREVAGRRPGGREGRGHRGRRATVIELHVADDDMGKVIGRNGSVAKALRTLLKVTAAAGRRAGPARDRLSGRTPWPRLSPPSTGAARGGARARRPRAARRGPCRGPDRPAGARFRPGIVLYREASDTP